MGGGSSSCSIHRPVSRRRDMGTTLSTLMPDVDLLLGGGFLPGELVELYGPPFVGKTTFVVAFAFALQVKRTMRATRSLFPHFFAQTCTVV